MSGLRSMLRRTHCTSTLTICGSRVRISEKIYNTYLTYLNSDFEKFTSYFSITFIFTVIVVVAHLQVNASKNTIILLKFFAMVEN